jgi:osmotically-inducible protein OsmY
MTMRMLASAVLILGSLINSACAPVIVGGAAATTASLAHDRRTTGTVVEDRLIKSRVRRALHDDQEMLDSSNINTAVFNGWVLLTGETPSENFRSRAGDLAREQDKVRRVYNELTIAAPSSFMTRSSDSWITTKVKSSLLGLDIEGFDPSRVKIVTENGTVYIMGLVYRAEAEAAVAQARQASGVQRVVKLFEYLD